MRVGKFGGSMAATIFAAIYMTIFMVVLWLVPGSKDFHKVFFNIFELIPPYYAGISLILHARSTRHRTRNTKLGWMLIGAGCLCFGIGESIWTYFELVLHQEAPFPGVADFAYIALYPCLIAGIVLVSNINLIVGRARIFLDSTVVAFSAGMVSWTFVIQKVWAASNEGLLGKIIGVFYPLGDIVCLFVALVGFLGALSVPRLRNMFMYLGCGILLFTFADTLFTIQTLNDTYQTGSLADVGWACGWFSIVAASYCTRWAANEATRGQVLKVSSKWRLLGISVRNFAPYAGAIIAIGVFFNRSKTIDGYDLQIFILFGLIIVRQVLMIMENVALNREIRTINESLEQRVAARTNQLRELQGLTKAINTTLEASEVVNQALTHTAVLFQLDGVALWQDRGGSREAFDWTFLRTHGFNEDPNIVDSLIGQPVSMATYQFQAPSEVDGSTYSFMYTPLLWQGQKIGQLAMARANSAFDEDEAALLEGIAVEVGTALMNSWLHADALAAADQDSVTGLLNHRAISQRLSRELNDAEIDQYVMSVVLMDLNNFKLFNDTYGHVVGDSVLKTVAAKVQEMSVDVGLAARYGGDEFLLILPHMNADMAEQIAERLRKSVSEIEFSRAGDDRKIPIGLSFGIASFPADGRHRYELLVTAEKNLSNAKGSESGIVRTTEGQAVNRELRAQSSFETLDILVDSIDNKDRYTRKHSEDVTEYALWIAEELNLSDETMKTVRMAGLLHDVGKIGVPDEVLKKPGRLTDEEYEMMKRHPRIGELIVKAIPGMEGIVDGVRCHHERWDGKGYPDELSGEDIPLIGRILGVADAFSAMTTNRPYRKGMEWDVALEQIRVNKGTQFDPTLAEHFLIAVSKRKPKLFEIPEEPKAA